MPSAINEKLRSFNEARRTWKAAIRAASLIGRAPAAAAAARSKRPFKPEALAPDVVEELRAAFAAYDTDGNGTIDLAELKQMMVALGAPEGEAERQMAAVDTSGNGVVTFAMFCTAVGPIYEHSDSALRRAFGLFDVDGSGFIEKNEVRGMLTKLAFIQADAPDSVVDKVMAFADADGDGRVSYEEVRVLLLGRPAADNRDGASACMHACMLTSPPRSRWCPSLCSSCQQRHTPWGRGVRVRVTTPLVWSTAVHTSSLAVPPSMLVAHANPDPNPNPNSSSRSLRLARTR